MQLKYIYKLIPDTVLRGSFFGAGISVLKSLFLLYFIYLRNSTIPVRNIAIFPEAMNKGKNIARDKDEKTLI